MFKKYSFGECETVHYFRPGKTLDDIALKKLHNSLIMINQRSGANVVNKMLDHKLSLEEIRNYLKDTIIAFSVKNNIYCGFLISPILNFDEKSILHAGLVIIAENPGADILSLLGMGNFILAYQKLGKIFITNISSTPSIIESFSELIPGSWPGPDARLKTPPKGYKNVVKILKDDYMDNFFPDSAKISVNYKRFTLTSNSKEMGFTTDFHQISRADNFKYNLFCHSWIDYNKEEDIIQVGILNLIIFLRMKFLLFKLKINLSRQKSLTSTNNKTTTTEQKSNSKVA